MILILPGFSLHNKKWADEIAQKFNKNKMSASAFYWSHWIGGSFSPKKEIQKLVQVIGKEKLSIIAKSVGVAICFKLIPKIADQVDKVILCGTASVSSARKKDAESALSKIDVKNLLCIQNDKDKFVYFEEAKKFYKSIDEDIKIISKPRADHNYPFFEDFYEFLKN